MLVSLKEIVGSDDYYIDDNTFQIVSFKQKKYEQGKILKPDINGSGYIRYKFYVNGKYKRILLHVIIVKLFIDPNFDSSKFDVDHMDRNRTNNSIDNLCIVSRSDNIKNMSKSWNGVKFNYVDDIEKSLIINKEAGIYYSLDLDKFYMYIQHTNKYKELHVCLDHGKYPYIQYRYNNKKHCLNIDKFKKSLNQ